MRACTRPGRRAFSVVATAFMISSLTAACDLLSEPKDPGRVERATVEVTGESPVPLLMVTSTVFSIGIDEEVGDQVIVISEADTVEVQQLPYQRTVSLAPTYRILFRLVNPDDQHEANVRMRVRLGDDVVYDQQATLKNASLQFSHVQFGQVFQ